MLNDAEAREIADMFADCGTPGYLALRDTGEVNAESLLEEIADDLQRRLLIVGESNGLRLLADYARHHAGRGPVPGWPTENRSR